MTRRPALRIAAAICVLALVAGWAWHVRQMAVADAWERVRRSQAAGWAQAAEAAARPASAADDARLARQLSRLREAERLVGALVELAPGDERARALEARVRRAIARLEGLRATSR